MTEQPTALRLAEIIGGDCAVELRRLHEEVTEQGRLLSMSAERELALLAQIDRQKKALRLALEALEWNLPVIEDWGGEVALNVQHKAIAVIYKAGEQA